MTFNRAFSFSFALYISTILTVAAQTDELRPKANPTSSGTSSNAPAVGQATPSRREASPALDKSAERPTPHRAGHDALTRRICVGCEPDRSNTGSMSDKNLLINKYILPDIKLDEIRKFPAPKTQADLDTLTLASAHREQADSAQEKTNGLWQSWLVSVCEGCGDQKPSKAWKLEDWPTVRRGPFVPDAMDRNASSDKNGAVEPQKTTTRQHGAFEADLSPENVGSIRRVPHR